MTADALTPRQADALRYVIAELVVGRAPTVRDAARALGVSSTATVARHLDALRAKGFMGEGWKVRRGVDGRPFTMAAAVLSATPTEDIVAHLAERLGDRLEATVTACASWEE